MLTIQCLKNYEELINLESDKITHCKILILCGGKGTRLGELGQAIPKTLVELDGQPLIYHKFSGAIEQGFTEFVVAVGYKGQMIVEACHNMGLNASFQFSDSGENAGMLGRIYDTKDMIGDRVVVTYGDSLSNINLSDLIEFHLSKKSLVSIVSAPIQSPFGLITSDHNQHVLTLEEKPILHYYIGTFILEKRAFDFIPNQILEWPDGSGLIAFFKILIAINKLHTYIHEGPDITFNTIEELNAAREGFLKFYTHFQ